MTKWIPEGMVLLGSLLGGLSLFVQETGGTEVPVADVMPGEASTSRDCGAISLYLICRISGSSTSLEEMRELTKTSVTGTSMFDIKEAAEQQGFNARGSRCSFDFLWDYVSAQGHYAILYFKRGHFAPAVHVADSKVIILDTRRLAMKDCSAEDLKTMGWGRNGAALGKTRALNIWIRSDEEMRQRNLLILGCFAITAFGGGVLGYFLRPPATGGAVQEKEAEELGLRLEPRVLDLGTVFTNREIEFKTVIRNYGDGPIQLAKIEPSCGCTSVSVTKELCQPGEDLELKGKLFARKPGKFRHFVRIIEDNKRASQLIFEVVGEAEAAIKAFPEVVVLNPSVFDNKTVEKALIFKNNSDERVVLRELKGLPEGISVKNGNGEIEPKGKKKVFVQAEPRFFLDRDLNISLPVSHSQQEKVVFRIELRPQNGFTVVPKNLSLGVVSKQELYRSPVRICLIGSGVKNLALKDIITPSFLKLAKECPGRDDRVEMDFSFAKSLPGISLRGAIRIELEVSAQESQEKRTVGLRVPISGLVRD